MIKFSKSVLFSLMCGIISQTPATGTDMSILKLNTDVHKLIILEAIKKGDYQSLNKLKQTNKYFNETVNELLEDDIVDYIENIKEKARKIKDELVNGNRKNALNEARLLYLITDEILKPVPVESVRASEMAGDLFMIGTSMIMGLMGEEGNEMQEMFYISLRIIAKSHRFGSNEATNTLKRLKNDSEAYVNSFHERIQLETDGKQEALNEDEQNFEMGRMQPHKAILELLNEIAPNL